ncbi:uncharacterized protein TRIVIDRAFT_218670 [Trichoderma virens Gv29-8]|uniref:Uncharacterized protein n=1 Tax=Hypocrea virens (strain Gv29-8 / FGSC 10586) TaxID=413071 RepID=G9MG66_HYPVG|nr:uncharacterized protein TRIVIDRAFT_218670 [Trichoderma virens Gv29-8]EHK26516.1 hypothetical protein TRIVIDRAFT_218670 [Trichoderma virens Gv29-8]UKZ46697.1 hypothetical protein TrVGV298_000904 [Trichoderma virens]
MDGQPPEPVAPALDPQHDDMDVDDAENVLSDLRKDERAEDLEADLWDAMGHFGKTGRLLSCHTLPDSLGGVSVKGVGNIALPLEEAQAQQISAHAREEEDQYDSDNLTELDPEEYTLDDAIWSNVIQGFLEQASRNLGVTTPLRAKPVRMLLMKRGFDYSETFLTAEIQAIGSLAIFLPSRHEGGEIVFNHRKTKKVVFAPSQAAQSFTTWHYKINSRPIKSGYLLVLIFSISTSTNWQKLDTTKFELPRRELQPLRRALRRWIDKDCGSRSPDASYYLFQDEYHRYRISDHLKPQDHILVRHLKRLSGEFPFEVFLAFIRRRPNGHAESLDQSKKYNAQIFSLAGNEVTNDGVITKGVLNSLDSLDTRSARAGVIIIPRDKIIPFFYGCDQYGRPHSGDAAWPLFATYARDCLKKDARPSSAIVFKQICSFMMAPMPKQTEQFWARPRPIDMDFIDVLEAMLVLKFYSWFSQYIQNALELPRYFLSRLRNWFAITDDGNKERLEAIEKSFLYVILTYPGPVKQLKSLKGAIHYRQERTQDGTPRRRLNAIPGRILHFARRVLNSCIEACKNKRLQAQDGQALAEFALYFDDPFEFLSLTIDKIGLERQLAAILGLIHKIDYYGISGYLPKGDCLKFSREVAKSLLSSADFVQWRGIPDGRYFVSPGSAVPNGNLHNGNYHGGDDLHNDDDLDLDDYEEHNEEDQDEGDQYEEYIEEEYDGRDLYDVCDAYDDEDFVYVDDYRTYLYHDDDDGSLRKLGERGYKKQYGNVKSSTSSQRGMKGKGVHFRSVFCFIDQIIDPECQILDPEDPSDGVLELLVSKVVDAAPHIRRTQFDALWMPLVKEFIPLMKRLQLVLGDYKAQLISKFLSAILKAYVNTWVGRYPERPSLSRPGVYCSCPDCKGLNVFLHNKLLRRGRFKADKVRVQHLLDEMARAKVDFKSNMVEDADSITLVVTKAERLLERARRQWGNRRYHASKQVAKFGLAGLEFAFGTEWMSFMSMAHLGGIGFDNLEIRTLLKLRTGLGVEVVRSRSATMFFRGLPRPEK